MRKATHSVEAEIYEYEHVQMTDMIKGTHALIVTWLKR